VISSPAGARPPNMRPSTGGNCPLEAISSHSPAAGYSPAFVARRSRTAPSRSSASSRPGRGWVLRQPPGRCRPRRSPPRP
jgi:hypothetical protein